jgi:hypothetical protein
MVVADADLLAVPELQPAAAAAAEAFVTDPGLAFVDVLDLELSFGQQKLPGKLVIMDPLVVLWLQMGRPGLLDSTTALRVAFDEVKHRLQSLPNGFITMRWQELVLLTCGTWRCQRDGCEHERTPESESPLSACGGCQAARYCSRKCQKLAWRVHKPSCDKPVYGAHMAPLRLRWADVARAELAICCQRAEAAGVPVPPTLQNML